MSEPFSSGSYFISNFVLFDFFFCIHRSCCCCWWLEYLEYSAQFCRFFWFLEILFRLGRYRRPTNIKQQTAQNSRQNQTNYHNRSQSDVFGNGFLAHDNMNEEERRQKENKKTKKTKTHFQRSHAELNGGTAVELNSNGDDDDDDVWRKMTTTSPRQRRRCRDDKLSIWNKKRLNSLRMTLLAPTLSAVCTHFIRANDSTLNRLWFCAKIKKQKRFLWSKLQLQVGMVYVNGTIASYGFADHRYDGTNRIDIEVWLWIHHVPIRALIYLIFHFSFYSVVSLSRSHFHSIRELRQFLEHSQYNKLIVCYGVFVAFIWFYLAHRHTSEKTKRRQNKYRKFSVFFLAKKRNNCEEALVSVREYYHWINNTRYVPQININISIWFNSNSTLGLQRRTQLIDDSIQSTHTHTHTRTRLAKAMSDSFISCPILIETINLSVNDNPFPLRLVVSGWRMNSYSHHK